MESVETINNNKLIAEFMGFGIQKEVVTHEYGMDFRDSFEESIIYCNKEPFLTTYEETWFGDVIATYPNYFEQEKQEEGFQYKTYLTYHRDWNELMPVVERIEEYETIDRQVVNTTWFHIMGKGCFVEYANKNIALFSYEDGKPMTKLEATYLCVIEFIKWYNKNKK